MPRKVAPAGLGGIVLIVLCSLLAQNVTTESFQASQAESVCLNEFLPKPACSSQALRANGVASFSEFIELYNSGSTPVDLSGWTLQVSPGGSLIIASGTQIGARSYWVSYDLPLPDRNGTVKLLNKEGTLVNQYAYSLPQCGRAIGRYPDGGSSWRDDLSPSPGGPNAPAPSPSPGQMGTPTCTSTLTRAPIRTPTSTQTLTRIYTPTRTRQMTDIPRPSATLYPTRNLSITICISEFLPAPGSATDWDGDGEANSRDEWIELHNASTEDLDLHGWKLDDRAGGGSQPYTFPAGAKLLAGEYHAYYLRDTGIALNNSGGDDVRLLAPDGTVVDSVSYEQTAYDVSYSRLGECTGDWTTTLPPSPGRANPVATPIPASMSLYLPLIQRPRS